MIDTDRSSQQNRNFWSRVKNWSSTTPAEGKHQQFGSLCTRCRENKKRQIEEAAELQAKMAANAARQLTTQGRLLAAPPAQGSNATVAALALPSDKALTETLRSAELNILLQGELQLVDSVDWQRESEAAKRVQSDLDRMSKFWNDFHSEHAGRVHKITSRSGPRFCPGCKQMETSLADPTYRRQHGNSPDVKLPDGVWYGTDGIGGDHWSAESSFQPTENLAELGDIQGPAQTVRPTREAWLEAAPTENGPALELINSEKFHKLHSQETKQHFPALDCLAEIRYLTSRDPVQDFMQEINHQPKQSEAQGNLSDTQSRAHRRDLRLAYLKVQETKRNAKLVTQPAADFEEEANHLGRVPGLNLNGHREPKSPIIESLDLAAHLQISRHQFEEERNSFSTEAKDHAALLREHWSVPPSDLNSSRPAFLLLRPIIDEKLRRLAFLATVKNLPPLPPQDEGELKALESSDRHSALEPISHNSPNTTWIEQPLGISLGGRIVLIQTIEHSSSATELPPLPPQDKEELEALARGDRWCRPFPISRDSPHTAWMDQILGQSHWKELEFTPRDSSLNIFHGDPHMIILPIRFLHQHYKQQNLGHCPRQPWRKYLLCHHAHLAPYH
jgi:hypothetical protein